jgi:hypothetical protein
MSPHVGDYGTQFNMTVYKHDGSILDISTATTRQMIFIDPSGNRTTTTGCLTTDGKDGKMYTTAASGLLITAGSWNLQGHVVYNNGEWSTDVQGFVVEANDY